MAAVASFPTPFLPCPGELSIPFDVWLKMFRNYLLFVNASGDEWPAARKRALFLHCLGTEDQRLFYTLPNQGETMEEAIEVLQAYFVPRRNVIAERHAFRKRTQVPGETVLQYVTSLRDLTAICEFGSNLDEMLRDQLVENVASHRIREKLLLETDLTLSKAITFATQIETAGEQVKTLSDQKLVPVQAIQGKSMVAVGQYKTKYSASTKPSVSSKTFKTSKASKMTSSVPACYRCGSTKHLANDSRCPAASEKCHNCQKIGHFSRVCHSQQTCSVHEIELPELQILYMQNVLTDKIKCTATITTTSVPVELIVDSGSSVSILPKSVYETYFKKDSLLLPSVKLVTYSRDPIPVLGCLTVTVTKNDVNCETSIFIVESGTALLGMDLINGLHLHFGGSSIPTKSAQPPAYVMGLSASVPVVKLGCAKGFLHKVKISSNVAPVRQKLVRNAVSEELQRLLDLGVIEKVDASPWVSPIVVVQKKSGGIRMCVDLREANKAVITDSYPLPHIDELLSKLCGATVFSTIDLESAYFQLPLHKESRDLTAFITHEGLFRFCRVPFGLASAPSAFQKMLSTVLQGLTNVAHYLDDIIVWGRTQSEHDCMLNKVVQLLLSAGLQLNTPKCQFSKTSLTVWAIQCPHKVFIQTRIILMQCFTHQFLHMHICHGSWAHGPILALLCVCVCVCVCRCLCVGVSD